MSEERLLEIEFSVLGEELLHNLELDLAACLSAGDTNAAAAVEEKLNFVRGLRAAREIEARRVVQFDPEESSLFGGLTNLLIDRDYEICEGIRLERVFAHVMAPFIVAFDRPVTRGAPHPGPWKAASGGTGYDVIAQISIPQECRPFGFTKLNSLWWITSLLRMNFPVGIRMPLFSNLCFNKAAFSEKEPILSAIEIGHIRSKHESASTEAYPDDQIAWLQKNVNAGSMLMRDSRFNLAYQNFDRSHSAHSPSAEIVEIWTALECLFCLPRTGTTKNIAICIATLLEDRISERNRIFDQVRQLYDARSAVVHAATAPPYGAVDDSFFIARRCFRRAIELQVVPEFAALVDAWKGHQSYQNAN